MVLLFGLLLSVLAFSQAAASIGIKLDTFRPLGGSFFSWRSAQRDLAIELFQKRKKLPDAAKLVRSGHMGLRYTPLSARSVWLVGKGLEARKDFEGARRVMADAERITRRDTAVQLWLAEDAFRRSSIAGGLAHYDLIMRVEPATQPEILPRLAAVMVAPEGRRYLQPYIRANNSWFRPLLIAAVNGLPRAEPAARLLIERRAKAPAIAELEPAYAKLVTRLVDEGSVDVALRLYPLLPNGKPDALGDVSGVTKNGLVTGYPPFIWSLANDSFGATLVSVDAKGSGIEFYGSSGTVGMAASKLVTPGAASQLRWRVYDRSTNLQSAATWIVTCVAGKAKGAAQTSVNLLDAATPLNKMMAMPLPSDCDVVRLDMRIAGGIGTNPASLIVGDLELAKAATAR
ncbi:MAG: hypothetical protein ABS88_15890 [Sphingopyxis sp. SCN 67-31]|nr:MAG: hypothetical protein ABS88_15890 [Sphingopyxis sp. SCN 67-31]